jgi:hypothetical protein
VDQAVEVAAGLQEMYLVLVDLGSQDKGQLAVTELFLLVWLLLAVEVVQVQ